MSNLKFEVGKFYADRKGRKWEVVRVDATGDFPITAVLFEGVCRGLTCDRVCIFTENGRPCLGVLNQLDTDLIAEWREPRDPREYDIWIDDAGKIVEDFMMRVLSGAKRIKVREVLEDGQG